MNYILYSTKHHGYWSKSGIYHSDMKQAQRFTRDYAIEMCKKHIDHEGNLGLVLMREDDLQEVSEK